MDWLIIFGAKYLVVAVVLIWIAAWFQAGRHHKTAIAWATIAAVITAAFLDKITAKLYYDPRPFASRHLHPLVAHAADNGFPSEHTLFSVTLAAVLFAYRPKVGIAAFIIALVVGVARVAAHVHSPIDIAGAVMLGAAAGYIGFLAASKLTKPKQKRSMAKPGDGRQSDPR